MERKGKVKSIGLPDDWFSITPMERMNRLQDIQRKVDVIRLRLARDKHQNMKYSLLKEEMTRHLT